MATEEKELKAKILAYISKEQEGLMYSNGNYEYAEYAGHEGAYHALCNLETFINSLPEEHPYKTDDKVWYLNGLYTLKDDGKHYILTSVRNNSIVHLDYGDEDFKLMPYEEPVSEDLEEAAEKYGYTTFINECMENGVCDKNDLSYAFKAGAQWQRNQGIVEDAEINYWNQRGLSIHIDKNLEDLGFKEGDKVKIIIVKDK